MSDDMLEWVYAYLETDDEIVVPIKKMWNEWHTRQAEPPLEDFTRAVLADPRFEEMRGVDHAMDMDWMSPEDLEEHEREMEEAGFFSGPRLKLRSREITLEHIAKMITRHNDRMESALRQARQSLPEDLSENQEGELIDLIKKVEEFRQSLRDAGLEEAGGEPDPPRP